MNRVFNCGLLAPSHFVQELLTDRQAGPARRLHAHPGRQAGRQTRENDQTYRLNRCVVQKALYTSRRRRRSPPRPMAGPCEAAGGGAWGRQRAHSTNWSLAVSLSALVTDRGERSLSFSFRGRRCCRRCRALREALVRKYTASYSLPDMKVHALTHAAAAAAPIHLMTGALKLGRSSCKQSAEGEKRRNPTVLDQLREFEYRH
jgi:hypothetical protein